MTSKKEDYHYPMPVTVSASRLDPVDDQRLRADTGERNGNRLTP